MAAVYSSVATCGNILKKYYEKDLEYINAEEEMPLLKEIDGGVRPLDAKGKAWVIDTEGPFGGGVGAYTETGDLPNPHAQDSVQAELGVKKLAVAFSITEELLEAAQNKDRTFINGLDKVMKEARTKLNRLMWFNAHSDGTCCLGKILTVTDVTPSVITLDTTANDAPTLALYGNIGDEIEAFNDKAGNTATIRTAVPKIAAIASNFATMTMDMNCVGALAQKYAVGDFIFLKGSRCPTNPGTATFYVPNGWNNMVDTSAVHLYDPSSISPDTRWWKPKYFATGVTVTEDHIFRMLNMMRFRNGNHRPTHCMLSPVYEQDIIKCYQGRQSEEYKGGVVTPGHEGLAALHTQGGRQVKWLFDDYQHPGRLDFFDVKVFRRLWLKKPSMLDKGLPLSAMRVANKAYWVGYITTMFNLACRMRPATGYIPDAAYTSNLWA